MIRTIAVEKIKIPADRQRTEFPKLEHDELVESITSLGLFQPIILRNGSILAAGERRLRAMYDIIARGANVRLGDGTVLPTGHVAYLDFGDLTPLEAAQVEYDENFKRKDPSWQDKARGLEKIMALRAAAGNPVKQKDLASEVHETPGAVHELLKAARLMADPEVAKAATAKEAIKISERKQKQQDQVRALFQAGVKSSADSIHTLVRADARDYLQTLPAGHFSVILTDPPYGIGIDGQKESKNKNPKHNRKAHDFMGWDSERPDAGIFNYIVGTGVPAVIWGGNYFADLLPATRGWLYWSKGQDGLTMSDGELAWTTEATPLRAVTVNRAALQGSVHPTQKPMQVIEFSLEYLKAGKIVLDLFGGSGTTLMACDKTERSARLMELAPKYCDVIVRRWQDFTGKQATLESNGKTYAELKNDH